MTQLMVALDFPSATAAQQLTQELQGLPLIYKVGLELFIAEGPLWVESLLAEGNAVFLDLKLYDIPNTVGNAVAAAAAIGVNYLTLHMSGGEKMMKAAQESLAKRTGDKPQLLGVSVLTSFDEESWGFFNSCGITPSVSKMAKAADEWGLDGMVCSAHELSATRSANPRLKMVIPGIRPLGAENQDQARVMTPSQAAYLGAFAVVVGRPIVQAANPRSLAEQILRDLAEK